MNFKTKRVFFTNFIIMLLCVSIPCLFFCTLISSLWRQQTQEEAFVAEETMLSLACDTFDMVLHDVTQIIGLIEMDDKLTESLRTFPADSEALSTEQLFGLRKTWTNTAHIILAKPYISNAYLYLESYPDLIFSSDERIIPRKSARDTKWLDVYFEQDPGTSLWTQAIYSDTGASGQTAPSIYIYRRLPYLQWSSKLNGTIAIRLESAYFKTLFGNMPQNDMRSIFILNDKFTQLYSLHSEAYTQYLSDEDIIFGERVHFMQKTEEGEFLISIVNSSAFNWSYISVLPLSAITARYAHVQNLLYLFIAIDFLVSLSLALFVTSRNYRPLRFMVQIIDNYQAGKNMENAASWPENEYGYVISNLVQTLAARQEAEKKLAMEKMLQREANLLAMQAQINPHFLYNTLDIINWEAINLLGMDNNISQMLLCLSSNLRYITQKGSRFVTLGEELDNLFQYITIQKLFTGDRIAFTYRIRKSLMEHKVPKLLLQPLVENAILHGLKGSAHGVIRITVRPRNANMEIRVTDNGCGFSDNQLLTIRRELENDDLSYGKSLGLKNVDHRLKLLYGKDYGLRIRTKQGFGSSISIFVPL